MDPYSSLLEKTRVPQPSLQKLAVIAIFDKFSSLPSDAGHEAINRCLRSTSLPAVVEQSTLGVCRFVKDAKLDVSIGLLELQSALEDCSEPQLTGVYVKSIGFLCRIGFRDKSFESGDDSSENHPFVKILSCGTKVEDELVKQIILFITKCKHLGMEAVCEYLRPFLNYSFVRSYSSSSSFTFSKNLISAMLAFCCSSTIEAVPLIKLLTRTLKYLPSTNAEEVTSFVYVVECLVDAYLVVLRQLVGMGLLVNEAHLCGITLVEAILSQHRDFSLCSAGVEKIIGLSRHLLSIQKELGLSYRAELSSVLLSLFSILLQSELEHESYAIIKLVLFLLTWKSENENHATANELDEALLFIFPALALVSSPSVYAKKTAVDVLSVLGNIASSLLVAPKEKQLVEGKCLSITTSGQIAYRFLRNLWFEDEPSLLGACYVNSVFTAKVNVGDEYCGLRTWTSSAMDYYSRIVANRKSSVALGPFEELFLTEMPTILCSFGSVLLLHQKGIHATDLMGSSISVEPKLGVPMWLIILFYNHIFSSTDKADGIDDMMLKLLGLLPPLVSHSAMIPLVLQFLQPMLLKDVNPVIKATAIRLLCRTWEMNDRIFGSLQGVLRPDALAQYASEKSIYISLAASILDVCKRNPDRGVDIILSVAACVEHHDPLVRSLGLQSLAHLCEADVVDFYTAWSVISNHTWNFLEDAVVSYGLSFLLRWGAMDADAYPEAASNVLNTLWDIAATHGEVYHGYLWQRARVAAITALLQYDVEHILGSITDFSSRNMEFLMSHANPEIISHLEDFEVGIINHEHMTRRRFVKQKSGSVSKVVKLLDIVPEVIFSSGSSHRIKDLPGAALLCLPSHKDMKDQLRLKDVHTKYEYASSMISSSLQLSRNILLALISLESWKGFMKRWMKSCILILEVKENQIKLDNNLKAANDILQVLTKLAESAVPRSAENIALALGALCLVLPSSAHKVKSMASKFLLNWLYQYEHEYQQWSAAISLGLISSCLHMTDHEQKFKISDALLEVASVSKSNLVKGACGVGLGFSCHDLLSRIYPVANPEFERDSLQMQEEECLRKIVRTLLEMIIQFAGSSSAGILEKLDAYFPLGTVSSGLRKFVDVRRKHVDELDEDTWGIVGPIIGLGNSIGAIYRAGAHDAVIYLKDLLRSWILPSPHIEPLTSERCRQVMSLGACLALPTVASFCQRVELIRDIELNSIVSGYANLISDLLSVERSDTFYQSFLMASCAGAGSILSVVLNAGMHSLDISEVKRMLELFRGAYTSPRPPLIHLGGMLGVVNAMGAGAGMLNQPISTPILYSKLDQKESSRLLGPLLSNHAMEAEAKSLIQEIFLVAQNSDDPQLQHYAAWTVTFLRHFVLRGEYRNDKTLMDDDSSETLKSLSQGIAEDSLVMKLSLWLTQMNLVEIDANISTATFVVRCLSRAPRVPSIDWGVLIRRCMKYGQVAKTPSQDVGFRKETLREECFIFSLSHANQFNSLLGFLDELSDLSRFKTLESNLQSLMLSHLADLLKLFSNARVAKLFDDVAGFFHWSIYSDRYSEEQRTSLRVSCWSGLHTCLNESPLEISDYSYNMERCMEVMFTMLPWSDSGFVAESCPRNSNMEWIEAIKCLGQARQGWLYGLLQTSDADFKEENQIVSCLKKIKAKAALVRVSSIPLSELGKVKAYFLDINSEFVWNILVEVAITLRHRDEDVRRQWLVEATEILCVTRYPSTVLRFIGLLCGMSCKYMAILVADKYMVLSDLPVALSSLLLAVGPSGWAESAASYLCKATQRLYDWAHSLGEEEEDGIDASENEVGGFLLQVMHSACMSLKAFLPLEKHLRLANMNIHHRS